VRGHGGATLVRQALWRVRLLKALFRFFGLLRCVIDSTRGTLSGFRMASGFDTRVSSNSNPTGIAKGTGDLGKGVVFTVTYAGC
jgi:hypothetical protein